MLRYDNKGRRSMTNDELLQMINDPPEADVSMSIRDGGCFLKVGEVTHTLTDRQAEVLYDHGGLMLMARIKLGRKEAAALAPDQH